ncbi:MAG: hypothetical protein Q9191_006758, partial [Dirinaria sp. TL-2023a]
IVTAPPSTVMMTHSNTKNHNYEAWSCHYTLSTAATGPITKAGTPPEKGTCTVHKTWKSITLAGHTAGPGQERSSSVWSKDNITMKPLTVTERESIGGTLSFSSSTRGGGGKPAASTTTDAAASDTGAPPGGAVVVPITDSSSTSSTTSSSSSTTATATSTGAAKQTKNAAAALDCEYASQAKWIAGGVGVLIGVLA